MASRRGRLSRYFPGKGPRNVTGSSSSSSSSSLENDEGRSLPPPLPLPPPPPPNGDGMESAQRRIRGKTVVIHPGQLHEDRDRVESDSMFAKDSLQNCTFAGRRQNGSAESTFAKGHGKTTWEESEESGRDSDDEATSESSGENPYSAPLLKPVFVPKNARVSEIEKATKRDKSDADLERENARHLEKIEETRNLVANIVAEEDVVLINGGIYEESLEGLPDDRDYSDDDDVQYALWKVRELQRIMRDREEEEEFARKRASGSP